MVPGGLKDSQRITGKKQTGCKESPEVTESNLLLKAGPASKSDQVAQSFVQLSFESLLAWKFRNPSGHMLQCFIILIMKNFFAHVQLVNSLATACDTASYPFTVYSPRHLPEPSIHSFQCCTKSTHPLQTHLYHRWISQNQPQNWEPPKQVLPVSWDDWQFHLKRVKLND